ncbi:MAG TPA: DNA repair exonuclease [Methanothrix sp.]|jgi:DNA repair exonuclease SbcCD nuclease subunit|uniref:metallophosphoesterase family protein n=1 Tax=Methanothrix sp. TaxID=90426 RepID=UPI002BCDC144|nr:DNA repair exonuclease [Methanothrix sp.]MDI9417447.1 DNA repair exonuclease [Euryarchaeota archaeon]HON35605.1 DNA repair exonuclease [Methanothrix sp.]HRU74740.1 DNA repair exonuclease [Methanothrix sp.]
MKIIHLADSHLGFSSYSRLDEHGRNRVEEMVYSGFEKAIDKIIEAHPDAVVHAGDVFHHVRPKIKPLFIFQRGLQRLVQAGIPVIIISGNHDAPKSFNQTSPFRLFEGIKDVHIAQRYRYECFEVDDCSFHCIPFCLEPQDYLVEFEKIRRSGRDVLVMHGMVESLKNQKMKSVGEHELNDSLLKSDFDYIALGHFHCQAQVSANAYYSGSVEYFNFGEAGDVKGMLLVDLERGEVSSIQVKPKYMIDHPPVDCTGMRSDEIAECIMELSHEDDILDRMVRINLKNVNRSAYRSIDQGKLNRLGASAIYFKIRADFSDEEDRIERPVDRRMLHVEFGGFMEERRLANQIPESIRGEVMGYGIEVMKKAVLARQKESIDAS